MKNILVIGAGKSSSALIDYLITQSPNFDWHITVSDADLNNAVNKTNNSSFATATELNVEQKGKRVQLISGADLVISLLPPALHYLVAEDCLQLKKHLLTASYIDQKISGLSESIKTNKLLFLCEMGLDPGIDHMSAMQIVHRIKKEGGQITSFKSHCGGLVAPESDDNPWHYKISWNPRNVVMAGKEGAKYKENGSIQNTTYKKLFNEPQTVEIYGHGSLAFYPNRDSLAYIPLYEMEDVNTFIRTTLRHPDFMRGWRNIINTNLTDEEIKYETTGKTLASFFNEHFARNSQQVHDEDLWTNQLSYLGLMDQTTVINKDICSAADVLQFALEKKLALLPQDKDMVIMLHEIEYELRKKKYKTESSLIVKGENSLHTAMSKTVGLPLGIAAMLLLEGKITLTGLHIPTLPEIYEPVLAELSKHGIQFHEATKELI